MRPHAALDSTIPLASPHRTSRARALAAWITNALWTSRMRRRRTPLTLALRNGEVAGFRVRRTGLVVRCLEGCLWITHDRKPGDHIVGPGERFVAAPSGHLVLIALASSRAVVSSGCEESTGPSAEETS